MQRPLQFAACPGPWLGGGGGLTASLALLAQPAGPWTEAAWGSQRQGRLSAICSRRGLLRSLSTEGPRVPAVAMASGTCASQHEPSMSTKHLHPQPMHEQGRGRLVRRRRRQSWSPSFSALLASRTPPPLPAATRAPRGAGDLLQAVQLWDHSLEFFLEGQSPGLTLADGASLCGQAGGGGGGLCFHGYTLQALPNGCRLAPASWLRNTPQRALSHWDPGQGTLGQGSCPFALCKWETNEK